MVKHKSIGSDFDDWLAEEGILKEVENAATKKACVLQLEAEMKKDREVASCKAKAKKLRLSHTPLNWYRVHPIQN